MLWLTGNLDVYPSWEVIPLGWSSFSLVISLLALLVRNFDRYLATYYPIFHRTSVKKGKRLTLFVILSILELILELIPVKDEPLTLLVLIILFPPMLFINYKLFIIVRKSRRNNGISPEMKKTLSLKNISSCLRLYYRLGINSKKTSTLSDNANHARFWNRTFLSMSCTCTCLIFYWKLKQDFTYRGNETY